MTQKYEITKAIHKEEYNRIYICRMYNDGLCSKVALDNKNWTDYHIPHQTLEKVSTLNVILCPQHRKEKIKELENMLK